MNLHQEYDESKNKKKLAIHNDYIQYEQRRMQYITVYNKEKILKLWRYCDDEVQKIECDFRLIFVQFKEETKMHGFLSKCRGFLKGSDDLFKLQRNSN